MENDGFSMVEVVIALAVFSISFLGFYNLQLTSLDGNAKARELTTSYVWASDMTERLLGLDYDDPLLETGSTLDSEDNEYTMTWTVVEDMPIVNVKEIRVTIERKGGIGSERQAVFVYYKSNKF